MVKGTALTGTRACAARAYRESDAPQPLPPARLLRRSRSQSASAHGEAPVASHGVEVDEDGNGLLADGRLYQLVGQHDAVHERTVEITFLEPGAGAYVFTFG